MSEKDIQSGIMKLLALRGYLVIRLNGGGFKEGKRYIQFYRLYGREDLQGGLPDIIALKGSQAILIEVKSKKGTLTRTQKLFHQWAKLHDVKVHVFNSLDDFITNFKM